jgi:hypothetical protein
MMVMMMMIGMVLVMLRQSSLGPFRMTAASTMRDGISIFHESLSTCFNSMPYY